MFLKLADLRHRYHTGLREFKSAQAMSRNKNTAPKAPPPAASPEQISSKKTKPKKMKPGF